MNPSRLDQTQFNILITSTIKCLIDKETISKEELIAEVAQQGIPAEWAYEIVKLISSLQPEPGNKR